MPGYRTYEAWTAALHELAKSPVADLDSLGQTAQEREIWLLTVGSSAGAAKPALAIVGSVDGRQPLGTELVMRMAESIVQDETSFAGLLDELTLFFIPGPSPDSGTAFFTKPVSERSGNSRPSDDDHDFDVDEDGPEDLNGDGLITMMRIEQPGGPWRTHPEDPRVMIRTDAVRNETGQYLLLSEGIDPIRPWE